MPELPEVETIKRGLEKVLIGKTISGVEVRNQKSFEGNINNVIGTKIINLERRAKMIRIKLSNELNLLFHLKMSGQLIYRESQNQKSKLDFAGGHPSHDWHAKLPNRHTHIIFSFADKSHADKSNRSKLFFNDLRKFGWCKVVQNNTIALFWEKVGIEPLSKDFTTKNLIKMGQKNTRRNIKQFLMDQSIIAGIGNIYADEILFEARIAPMRKVKDLSNSDWQKIKASIVKVLNLALKYGGTTDRDYVNSMGKKGGMQEHLKVYHRTGQPCLGCKGEVKRIRIGNRSAHYCPTCQQ